LQPRLGAQREVAAQIVIAAEASIRGIMPALTLASLLDLVHVSVPNWSIVHDSEGALADSDARP
jgi:hypothetical protein